VAASFAFPRFFVFSPDPSPGFFFGNHKGCGFAFLSWLFALRQNDGQTFSLDAGICPPRSVLSSPRALLLPSEKYLILNARFVCCRWTGHRCRPSCFSTVERRNFRVLWTFFSLLPSFPFSPLPVVFWFPLEIFFSPDPENLENFPPLFFNPDGSVLTQSPLLPSLRPFFVHPIFIIDSITADSLQSFFLGVCPPPVAS